MSPLLIAEVAAVANVENSGNFPLELGCDEKCLSGTSSSYSGPFLSSFWRDSRNNLLWRYWIIISKTKNTCFQYIVLSDILGGRKPISLIQIYDDLAPNNKQFQRVKIPSTKHDLDLQILLKLVLSVILSPFTLTTAMQTFCYSPFSSL